MHYETFKFPLKYSIVILHTFFKFYITFLSYSIEACFLVLKMGVNSYVSSSRTFGLPFALPQIQKRFI